jgi:hypothetical protein
MYREFSVVRVKKDTAAWEFPISYDEALECPLAGAFDPQACARLDLALGRFPFARRTGDGRRAWRIHAPGRGLVEAWVTSDGSLYLDGDTSLQLIYGVFVHLLAEHGELALEDRITNMLHNQASLLRLVRRDEARAQGMSLEGSPNLTPPLAA